MTLSQSDVKVREMCEAIIRDTENLEADATSNPFCGVCNMGAGPHKDYCSYHAAKRVLADMDAQEAAQGVGEWVVVPREPTEAMIEEICCAMDRPDWVIHARQAYAAILYHAAPVPPCNTAGDARELLTAIASTGNDEQIYDMEKSLALVASFAAHIHNDAVEECAKVAPEAMNNTLENTDAAYICG